VNWEGSKLEPKISFQNFHVDLVFGLFQTLADLRKRAEQFKRICVLSGVIFVSSTTKKGLDEFRDKIVEVAESLPVLKLEVPKFYQVLPRHRLFCALYLTLSCPRRTRPI